jgi:hypothetical protein
LARSPVIAGLDPAIHQFQTAFEMDARVKPADDGAEIQTRPGTFLATAKKTETPLTENGAALHRNEKS